MINKEIKNNPFSSELFEAIWVKHFSGNNPSISLESIEGLKFVRHSYLPLFYNVGRTNTKGIYYKIIKNKSDCLNKKVLLIYDVPGYFETQIDKLPENIAIDKVQQYPGFLINLDNYSSIGEFMGVFSKRTRYKLNKCKKRLEQSFDINYKVYFGEITGATYEHIFTNFRKLLEKRFDDKGIANNNLENKEWSFYHNVSLPLIREKKAALSVIYENENPIAITLNFIGDGIIFDTITVFDICYQKFNLGYVHMMYLIDWSIKYELKIFDFSKGFLEYKVNWSNLEYPFYYHIIHDTKHIPSHLIASSMKYFFILKQKLRDLELNKLLQKLTFYMKRHKDKEQTKDRHALKFINEIPNNKNLLKIEHNSEVFKTLKSDIISFLFLHDGHINEIEVYSEPSNKSYYIKLRDTFAKIN